jgi:3-deoxy-7-phosphoheptulonate synthase
MTTHKTEDLRIESISDVITPAELHREFPLSDGAATLVHDTRADIARILVGDDERLLVIAGPCSIHDPAAAREYASRLHALRTELAPDLLVVMRVYFEKPRTTVGWKGLINDPDLDGRFNINKGLRLARSLLLELNESGVPAGTEFLDVVTPQYVTDLVSWGAIGARTTESQVHRELASGLSCPVGFKNGTDGTVQIAVDAIRAARHPHVLLALTQDAHSAIFKTTGNQDTHIILRGGHEPNYDAASVASTCQALTKAGLQPAVMVDFSHANSRKKPELQAEVCADVAAQLAGGDRRIVGVMIESHLKAGRQDAKPGMALEYGKSITDGCASFEQTESMLRALAGAVAARRKMPRAARAS